jgi:hypothetical protein
MNPRPRLAAAALLLALAAACRAGGDRPGEPPAAAPNPFMDTTPRTLEAVRASDCWAVAALRCLSVSISEPGTRSQTMTLSAEVLSASDPRLPARLALEHYADDDAILQQSRTYVAVLAGSGGRDPGEPVAWTVVQRAPIAPADAAAAVERVHASVQALLRPVP